MISCCGVAFPAGQPPAPPSEDDVIGFVKLLNDGSSSNAREMAIRQAGLSAGSQAGFASRAKSLRDEIRSHAAQLDSIYLFQPLVGASGMLPPVISEATNSVKYSPGRMVVAGKTYQIVLPGRLVGAVPTWRDYLFLGLSDGRIDSVSKVLEPKNEKERAVWAEAVKDGWSSGVARADLVYKKNLDRLNRDYVGMVTYKRLLALGMIKAPLVASGEQADKVTDTEFSMNVRTSEVMSGARMSRDRSRWKSGMVDSSWVEIGGGK